MTIRVNTKEFRLAVPIPAAAALTAAKAALCREGIPFRLMPLLRELARIKKQYPDLALVEVDAADGTHVEIRL